MKIESNKKRPISKLAAKMFTPEQVIEKSLKGYHGDETMEQVFMNIIHDPHVVITQPDKKGNCDIFYDDKNIGWMNLLTFKGWIDNKAYDKLQKYVAPEEPLTSIYDDNTVNEEPEDIEDYPTVDGIDASKKITAADEDNIDEPDSLEEALKAELRDASLMEETVNAIYSNTGDFDQDIFMEADEFFDLNSKKDPKDLIMDFFNGKDLETGKDHANPTRDYFRRDGYDHVESANYPGEVYVDAILDEVVDHIMDNPDDTYYPDDILIILDNYTEEEIDEDIEEE